MAELRACDCGAVDVDSVRVVTFEHETDGYLSWAEAWVQCKSCQRHGPECSSQESTEDAIAAAIAGWNHRPEEDKLRAALSQAQAYMRNRVPALYDDYILDYICECCGGTLQGEQGDTSHPDGHPDCEYVQTLAAIDAALEGTP